VWYCREVKEVLAKLESLSRHAKLIVELGSGGWIKAGAHINSAEPQPRGVVAIVASVAASAVNQPVAERMLHCIAPT